MSLIDRAQDTRVSDAEKRWTAINANSRAAGCPCGSPATEVRYDDRNMGSVPVETWTCADHVGAAGWSGRGPTWPHPQACPAGESLGEFGPHGGPSTTFYCAHRTHGVTR